MSSISLTHRIKKLSVLKDGNVILLILAALVAISAVSMTSPAATPFDYTAYMLHRQGEWLSMPIAANGAEAYQIYRRGEVTSPVSNAEAYLVHRQGEWVSVEVSVVDLASYHLSERTLVDAQAGMAAYFQSERTHIPVGEFSAFNNYQRSEWFGD